MWRELFHDEVEERPQARLRNEGEIIGARGKSSEGMPWRQIPNYNKQGTFSRSGDTYGSINSPGTSYGESIIRPGVDLPGKRKGAMSPKHWAGGSMKRLLSPVTEGAVVAVAGSPPQTPSTNHWQTEPEPEDPPKYRPITKGVATTLIDPRIASPYPRYDDHRPQTAPPRRMRSAPVWFESVNPPPEDDFREAEHVEEARRDWRYIQEKPENEYIPGYMQTTLSRNLSSRSLTTYSVPSVVSLRSVKSNASNYVVPIHSVRARAPEGMVRPRWKPIPKRWK